MWAQRLDLPERVLLVVLGAFPFLPFAVSSCALAALAGLRLIADGSGAMPRGREWMMLTPAFVCTLAWAAYGFAPDGWREVKLWGILPAAMVCFRNGHHRALFNNVFVVWCALAALSLAVFLLAFEPLPGEALSQHIRDTVKNELRLHPTYLGAAWAWAAIVVWSDAMFKLWQRAALTALFVALVITVGGKMPLVALTIVGAFGVWRHTALKPIAKWAMVALAVVVLAAAALSPLMRERFAELATLNTRYESDQWLTSTDLRVGVWQCATKTALENARLGVGTGNTRTALEQCFANFGHPAFMHGEYNTHNQFLHFWLIGGVGAFAAFVVYWLWLLKRNKKHRTAYLFTLFFLLICLTENYLTRQWGMMLFVFFIFGKPPKSERDQRPK